MNGCAPGLALIERLMSTRKRTIIYSRVLSSSETQGQLVGSGKSLNGREKNSGEEKSRTNQKASDSLDLIKTEHDRLKAP